MRTVISSSYSSKESRKGDSMLVVEHEVEGLEFPVKEYVLFDHEGFAKKKAKKWWLERATGEPPESVEEAIDRINDIKDISAVKQDKDENGFWKVTDVRFEETQTEKMKTPIDDDDIPF